MSIAVKPTNSLVCSLLTDMYEITMAFAYWKSGQADHPAVFDLFFRKNPFKGEFCVFAGLEEILRFIETFQFTDEHIAYLQSILPSCDPEFFIWLKSLDCSQIKVYSMHEGTISFPREPLIRIEGPIAIGQLLETTLLNLVNFPSLIATNAARMRIAAGNKRLLEFGLRRAQGPDGAMSASKYSFIGGFDGTSNLLAGMIFGLPVKGTHAHSYVMSHMSLSDLKSTLIEQPNKEQIEFVSLVLEKRRLLGYQDTNEGELAAFISYAQAFPNGFVALVDTYDTLISGVPNFLSVGWALSEIGYKPIGIRLDSGDLGYLSVQSRKLFKRADDIIKQINQNENNIFIQCTIIASNDLNEEVITSLQQAENEIDVYAVGTNLVTCQSQPALGCVYKLVEISDQARIKLSQEVEKTVIPGKKNVYRLYGSTIAGPVIDVIQLIPSQTYNSSETAGKPEVGKRILCRHPFQENKRAYIVPTRVDELLHLYWDGKNGRVREVESIETIKQRVVSQLSTLRSDHIRHLNPTPYKVSVDGPLYDFMHNLWMSEAPISDLT